LWAKNKKFTEVVRVLETARQFESKFCTVVEDR
jgi:hypothetical protein